MHQEVVQNLVVLLNDITVKNKHIDEKQKQTVTDLKRKLEFTEKENVFLKEEVEKWKNKQ